jgi:hypothetical protein
LAISFVFIIGVIVELRGMQIVAIEFMNSVDLIFEKQIFPIVNERRNVVYRIVLYFMAPDQLDISAYEYFSSSLGGSVRAKYMGTPSS